RLWFHDYCGDPLRSPGRRTVHEGSQRQGCRRQQPDVSSGTFLLCHQPGILYGAGYVPQDRRRYLPRTARLREGSRRGPYLYGREKEYLAWQERKDRGVPVGESIQKEFIALRDACGLDYHFPFED